MIDISFSELLRDAMNRYEVGPAKLEELLKERGIENINFRRISEYYYGKTTPPYEKAKLMMETLGEPVQEQQLIHSLSISKETIRAERELHSREVSNEILFVNVRLRNVLYDSSYSSDTVRDIIYSRIEELYGNRKNVSAYIEELIRKDLLSKEGN